MSIANVRVRQDEGGSDREWGSMTADYIPKREACERCSQKRYLCMQSAWICLADCDIKYDYKNGRKKKVMDMLRCLPTDALKEYMSEACRTPTELKAVILDELQAREKEEAMRL